MNSEPTRKPNINKLTLCLRNEVGYKTEQKEEKLEIQKTEHLCCSVSVAGSDLGYSYIGIYTIHTYVTLHMYCAVFVIYK
jgi:hypothetical protein